MTQTAKKEKLNKVEQAKAKKHPFTVPEEVIAKDKAAESALLPADATDHAAVFLGAVYAGAFVAPASTHPV